MKKLYSTLAVVALGAATAMAATNFQPLEKPSVLNPALHSAMVKELNTKNFASHRNHAKKVSPRKAADVASLAGEYINVYMPIFSNYLEQEMTEPVTVAVEGDVVTLSGLMGWSYDAYDPANVTVSSLVTGTLVDEGTITVAAGQELGSYPAENMDLVLCLLDEEGEVYIGGEATLTVNNGVLESDYGFYIACFVGEEYAGGWSGCDIPALVPANGTCTYEYDLGTEQGEVSLPVYYEFLDNGDGTQSVTMSCVNRLGDGYLFEWQVTEDGIGFIEDVLCYSNKTSSRDSKFYYCCTGGQYYGTFIAGDFADPTMITWPTPQVTYQDGTPIEGWMVFDPTTRSYYGDYTPATLMGEASGIEGVAVDNGNANGAAEYYNLQGVRVNNPSNGIYIVKRGNSTSKMLVK